MKTRGANPGTNGNNNAIPNKKKGKLKLCHLCEELHLTINCPKLVEARRLLGQNRGSKQPVVLSNPFPNKGHQTVVGASQIALQWGNQTSSHQEVGSSKISNIYIVNVENVNVQTRTKIMIRNPRAKRWLPRKINPCIF